MSQIGETYIIYKKVEKDQSGEILKPGGKEEKAQGKHKDAVVL